MKDVARFLKTLADESRLKMLWLLFNHRELCVCDIMAALGISQSKASRHLATLRHAGLVADRREGAWSFYSICTADDQLERAVLETLRARLAGHAAAAQSLGDLHAWLGRKERDGGCAPESTSNRKPNARRRAVHSGADR